MVALIEDAQTTDAPRRIWLTSCKFLLKALCDFIDGDASFQQSFCGMHFLPFLPMMKLRFEQYFRTLILPCADASAECAKNESQI